MQVHLWGRTLYVGLYGQRVSTSVIFKRYWQISLVRTYSIFHSHKHYIKVPISLEHCPHNYCQTFGFLLVREKWYFDVVLIFIYVFFYYKWGWASFHLFKCFIFIFMWTVFWILYISLLCWSFSSLFLRAFYILSSIRVANIFSQSFAYVLVNLWWCLSLPF